jgi:hypothetical protein
MNESIFGVIKTGGIVEQSMIDTLRDWFPTYLRELELQLDMTAGLLPAPKSYSKADEFEWETGQQLPAAIVISPGLAGHPLMDGERKYRATWTVAVGVIVSADTQEHTNELAKIYAAAVRAIVLQHGSLGEKAGGSEWIDEGYDDLPPDANRSMAAATMTFEIEVEDVIDRQGGPAYPIQPNPESQPGSEWPLVETAEATLEIAEEVEE